VLSETQQREALSHLRNNAEAALAFVQEETQGYGHKAAVLLGLSGENGSGELSYCFQILGRGSDSPPFSMGLLAELERAAPAAREDDAKSEGWSTLAQYAEDTLREVKGYAVQGEVASILKATAAKTAEDVKAIAEKVAVPLSFGAGFGLVALVAVVLVWKLGLPHRSTA
jgi:hypothetical protein